MSFTADIYNGILTDLSAEASQTFPFAMRLVKFDNDIMIAFAVNIATKMRAAFLSVAAKAPKNGFPHWKGVQIETVTLPDYGVDMPFVGLFQLQNSASDIFEIVVEDLRSRLEAAENITKSLPVIITVLTKWKDFFAADKELLMAEERQQGLYGEMLFLSECLEAQGPEAVLHWAGSDDETHDFYFGPHAVEVKTTAAQAPYFASISSEYQLDKGDVPGKLFLRFYALRKSQSGGEKLPERIAAIRGRLRKDISVLQKFDEKLKKYGYFDEAADYYTTGYYQRDLYCFAVDDGFPKITKESIAPFKIDVIQTKRHISCNGSTRKGEDVIVTVPPKQHFLIKLVPKPLPEQVSAYPPTRFMGSKSKLLSEIWSVASQFQAETVVDLFSGSGIVGYMFKAQGKTVISNDYMSMSATFTKAMVENNNVTLPLNEAKSLLVTHKESDHFVASTFKDLYYTDDENDLIDTLRTNITGIHDQYKRAIAMTALIRACTKKRPRGIFTYTGNRYNDGRKDLQKTLSQQFLEAVDAVNKAVFDNGKPNKSRNGDAMDLRIEQADLVYIDPPYYSPLSDNEYVRRYHFVEGLARDWKGVEIQEHTQTKKFKSYPTPFSTRKGAADAFDRLFKKFANSVLIVSYSSNSLPTQDEMVAIMAKYKKHVEVVPVDYKYSFGNQSDAKTHRNSVQEYLFVGY